MSETTSLTSTFIPTSISKFLTLKVGACVSTTLTVKSYFLSFNAYWIVYSPNFFVST